MSLNLLKTNIIVFRNGGIVKEIEHWFYQGEHIDIVLLYRKYKLVLEIESYLTIPELSYVYRKTLANFRCTNHPLMIEKRSTPTY